MTMRRLSSAVLPRLPYTVPPGSSSLAPPSPSACASRLPPLLLYNCGPTIYSPPHIGHAYSTILLDFYSLCVLRCNPRVPVITCGGLTDVDSKIIKHSKELASQRGEDFQWRHYKEVVVSRER